MCFLKSPIVRYLQQHKCNWSKVKNKNTIWHTDKHHDMLQLLCCSVSIVVLIFVSLWQHMNLINYVWAAGALSFIHQLKIYIYILVLLFFCCYCDSWGSSNISITFKVKKKMHILSGWKLFAWIKRPPCPRPEDVCEYLFRRGRL